MRAPTPRHAGPVIGPDGQPVVPVPGVPIPGARCWRRRRLRRRPRRADAVQGRQRRRGGGEQKPEGAAEGDFDDDDMENSLSLAAIEAELKPKVLETFDNVADSYKRLRRLQDQDIEFKLKNTTLSPAQERRYKKLKDDIIAEVKSLRLNQARIDSLVEQLYDINKRLVGYEGRLMRLSESHGVSREDFLKNYQGSSSTRAGSTGSPALGQGLEELRRPRQGQDQGPAPRDPVAGHRDRARDRRVPQDRADGAEGRARGAPGQEGDGGGEPAAGDLDRQEIHQPRPAVPRPDPGRQHRADEGGRQVRCRHRGYKFSTYATWWIRQAITAASPTRRAPSASRCT